MTETVLKPVFVTSSKIWTNYEISSEATPDCHFRLMQGYFSKSIWSFCSPHLTVVGVNSARECEIRFICPKHRVKPVVLLFHLVEYQIHKILARVEVRRFQYLVMLQLVGLPFQVIRSALQILQYRVQSWYENRTLPPP